MPTKRWSRILLRREEGQHLNDHRPHAKRPQRAPLQSHVKANRTALQSARRPWLGRLPDAWCWRRRSVRTGQWQLPSRRANQGSCGCRPLHQCVGKESSRHSLNANSPVLQIAVRSSASGRRPSLSFRQSVLGTRERFLRAPAIPIEPNAIRRASGRQNGNYRHGGRTKAVADAIRYINGLAKKARDFKASTTVPADQSSGKRRSSQRVRPPLRPLA